MTSTNVYYKVQKMVDAEMVDVNVASKKLTGDKNQCQGCMEYFNSSYSFDKHRTGDHGSTRRCRTSKEMLKKGMSLNNNGFWISSVMPVDKIKHHD